jgi:hypothetical protein
MSVLECRASGKLGRETLKLKGRTFRSAAAPRTPQPKSYLFVLAQSDQRV